MDTETKKFEQYKIFIDSAESMSSKRMQNNALMLTLSIALFSVVLSGVAGAIMDIIGSIIGISLCVIWYLIINNYRKRNAVKYDIINEYELTHEPITSLFYKEWLKIKNLTKLTTYEKLLPLLLAIGHLAIIIVRTFL